MKLLIAFLIVLLCIAGSASASCTTGSNAGSVLSWVNVKSCGATGNGSTDDTAAIQAAIDYAFANSLHGIYCPAGSYKTTDTLWLDPPGDMRATYWTGTGYIAGTTFTVSTTTANSLAIGDYITGAGVAAHTFITAGSNPTWTVNNSQTVASSGSPISMTANHPSVPSNFAFTVSFFGDLSGSGNYQGCKIQPNFNNATAFIVGPGQGMRVSDLQIVGPQPGYPAGYRANQDANGIGLGIAGGSGGASITLIENVDVENFYTLYKTDANGACCLSDSNTWRKVSGGNAYYGFWFYGNETDINRIDDPRIQFATVMIESVVSRPVNVTGGNLSSENGQNTSFSISGVSTFTKTANGNGNDYTFTATIASPDSYIPKVYNSYAIVTSHFGVVPMTMTAWNSGTSVGTFKLWPNWVFANYGTADLTTTTHLQTEIDAATTIYAAERSTLAEGMGITIDGVHVENPGTCTTLFNATAGYAGGVTNEVRNVYFNFDPSAPSGTANQYCQDAFPFIEEGRGSIGLGATNTQETLNLNGGFYGNFTGSQVPLTIETGLYPGIKGERLGGLAGFNIRVYDTGGYAYNQTGSGTGSNFASEGRGAGTWDNDYFFYPGNVHNGVFRTIWISGELTSPFCGYEPCPWAQPQLSAANYSLVSGSLGSLGSYPPIACRTVFKSVDYNTGSLAHLWLRSASCPGWSWGQNLTNATVGGAVTWSYMGGSDVLYIDSGTMGWMFPGLGISIDNGSGPQAYTVTGVWPSLGYITVIGASVSWQSPLVGTNGTVYSCASSCTIGQAAFAWTAY